MLDKDKNKIGLEKERKYCADNYARRKKGFVPPFSFGEEFLLNNKTDSPEQSLLRFSHKWLDNPNHYLELKKYSFIFIPSKIKG